MRVRLAAAQPRTLRGTDEYKNVDVALSMIEEAARQGAHLICFPEGYPGPYSGPLDFAGKFGGDAHGLLRRQARMCELYVAFGGLEPAEDMPGAYFLFHELVSPEGEVLVHYRRMQPNHPIFNEWLTGGRKHILPGNTYGITHTRFGEVGIVICSEIFTPEIPRVLMLMGARILLNPGAGMHAPTRASLTDTWHIMARARAVENHLYVLVTQNMFSKDGKGRAAVIGPHGIIGAKQDVGLLVADVDLDCLDDLRGRYYDEEILRSPNTGELVLKARPGQTHDRRPEIYGKLVEPQPDAFDYHYYRHGLESYRREYEKIRPRNRKPGEALEDMIHE